ncbi:hypothetical protein DL98DRAFT_551790 [Cadophora sp. DSE1049]|nr:hypothetical protein DL98DRAFT_551790 [Cadophora sp. DSE1049]
MATLSQLQAAASDVIEILKTVPHISSCRIAVICGLALWNSMPYGRGTKDIDFLITLDGAPRAVKDTLLRLHGASFVQRADTFYYIVPNGPLMQVDICPGRMVPFIPASSMVISTIPIGVVPYLSATDLLAFKINSCGLRADIQKRRLDAQDAVALLAHVAQSGPLTWTPGQRLAIEKGLGDVVSNSVSNETWWRGHLGI